MKQIFQHLVQPEIYCKQRKNTLVARYGENQSKFVQTSKISDLSNQKSENKSDVIICRG